MRARAGGRVCHRALHSRQCDGMCLQVLWTSSARCHAIFFDMYCMVPQRDWLMVAGQAEVKEAATLPGPPWDHTITFYRPAPAGVAP